MILIFLVRYSGGGRARHYVSAVMNMKKKQVCVIVFGFKTTFDTWNSLDEPKLLILKVV